MSLNWQRRHLSESQRADIAAKLIPSLAEELKTEKTANFRKFAKSVKTEAKERAAELMNVSPRTVDSAIVVEKQGTPEIKAAVSAGDLSVSAAVKEIKNTELDGAEPTAVSQNSQHAKIETHTKSEYLIDRHKLESFGQFVIGQLVKIEERAARLKEPIQERLHELLTRT